MPCEVAALPFQAHANYGTWSIDFGATDLQARITKKITPKFKDDFQKLNCCLSNRSD